MILTSMIEAMDEYYIWDLKEKVTRGMTENVLEGKFNGGQMPYGYKKNPDSTRSIEETDAAIVRDIFSLYAKDEGSIKTLLEMITEKGYKNRGKKWSNGSLRRLLSNRIYVGEYKFKDMKIQGKIPPIVDPVLFDKVQEKLKRNRRKAKNLEAKERYLLSKLRCAECGGMMMGESVNKKNGKTYRYYKCQHAKRGHNCDMPSVPKELIENAVIEDAKAILNNTDLMDKIVYEAYLSQEKDTPLMKSLSQQLSDTASSLPLRMDTGMMS